MFTAYLYIYMLVANDFLFYAREQTNEKFSFPFPIAVTKNEYNNIQFRLNRSNQLEKYTQ